jgi:hypothetical protein
MGFQDGFPAGAFGRPPLCLGAMSRAVAAPPVCRALPSYVLTARMYSRDVVCHQVIVCRVTPPRAFGHA